MTPLTYCDNGHLWDRETEQRCVTCAAEQNEHARRLLEEMQEAAIKRHWAVVREKLRLLKVLLTD